MTEEQLPTSSPSEAASQAKRPRDRKRRPERKGPKEVTRFITVIWSGEREPVDNLILCEIEKNGQWLTLTTIEQVRTRREVLEYLREVDAGLIGLDFSFSFPAAFVEFVRPELGLTDLRSLIHRVREEFKKNADDGSRLWIDRIGRYRESKLVPESQERPRYDDRRGRNRSGSLAPYDRRSIAERFRRTEHSIRRAAEQHVTSALQIAYNRLTSRYEFSDERQRGRSSLLGMSMLDQLLETKPEARVWPFSKPGDYTIVEVQPWLFDKGRTLDPEECRKLIAIEEDNALEIDAAFRDLICRNPLAQRAFFTTLGMIRAENRVERAIRPLRDYPEPFYTDPTTQIEGWYYGVGYRSETSEAKDSSRQKRGATRTPALPDDLDHAAAIPTPTEEVMETAVETAPALSDPAPPETEIIAPDPAKSAD